MYGIEHMVEKERIRQAFRGLKKEISKNFLFAQAFEKSLLPAAIVSLKGEWVEVNDALCNLLDMTREELLATDFQSITLKMLFVSLIEKEDEKFFLSLIVPEGAGDE